jgi:hypothetical protein
VVSDPAIKVGDKLHIITRRRFENDLRRHFVGEVTAISDGLQEIRGYAFVFSSGVNEYKRQPEVRTRLFSIAQEGFIVTKIPSEVAIASLNYRLLEKRLVVTDGAAFRLDINEFGSGR